MRDLHHRIQLATLVVRMRGLQPVRIYLHDDQIEWLMQGLAVPRKLRYCGLPVTRCAILMRARVVGADGYSAAI